MEGMTAVNDRMMALVNRKEGLWQVKAELYDLLMQDLDPILAAMTDTAKQVQIRAELRETLGNGDEVVGVFPVGGPWGKHTGLDIRFKPSLQALRFSQLVKRGLHPFLKEHPSLSIWVPLSRAEMSKKRKRQEESGLGSVKGRGRGPGRGGGRGGPRVSPKRGPRRAERDHRARSR